MAGRFSRAAGQMRLGGGAESLEIGNRSDGIRDKMEKITIKGSSGNTCCCVN